MNFLLILQTPYDKVNAVGCFADNIQYSLDGICMIIKLNYG